MKLDLHEIANWSGAKLPHSEPNPSSLIATGYSIDSRTLQSGDLFFAVKGERFDGNDFVAAAIKHGAIAAVVSRAKLTTLPAEACKHLLLVVDDPLAALQHLATAVR